MQCVLLREDQVYEAASQGWTTDTETHAIVADALRAELWARTTVTRRPLCQRVVELLQPARRVELATVNRVLREMERASDVTLGERGLVAAAPLRAVDLGGGRYLLAGGPASRRLGQLLECDVRIRPTLRVVEVDPGLRLPEAISAAGGVVLTPGQWAGLDRVRPAGAEWLNSLDTELEYGPAPATALPDECDEWRYYQTQSDDSPRLSQWRNERDESRGQLWRARNNYGYWVYVWTNGQHPQKTSHVRLSPDDSHRTRFSLDRDAGKSASLEFSVEENSVRLEVGTMLPIAEYRFLLALGSREPDRELAYRFPTASWPQAKSMLKARLGVVTVRIEST